MAKMKRKNVTVSVYMTNDQKKQIDYLAKINGKDLSPYMVEKSLVINHDTAKADFYNTIDIDLNYLKRSVYVLTKLCMALMNLQFKDPDLIKKFTAEAMDEAEMYFSKKN